MGKTILTPNQNKFLELAQADEEINRWFYLTGGTALSEYYLQHRLSDDIDLFSFSQVNDIKTDNFIHRITPKLKIKNYSKDHIMGLYTYKIYFSDDESLKVDFNEYPFEQVEKSNLKFGNINIDSFYDIAINKAQSVTGRFQTRDFIDLFFILKKDGFFRKKLTGRGEEKIKKKNKDFFPGQHFLKGLFFPPPGRL